MLQKIASEIGALFRKMASKHSYMFFFGWIVIAAIFANVLIATSTPSLLSFNVSVRSWIPYQPLESNSTPIELHGKGKKIPNWKSPKNCAEKLKRSPVKSNEPIEEITLIHKGCARLRISSFPTIGEGQMRMMRMSGS